VLRSISVVIFALVVCSCSSPRPSEVKAAAGPPAVAVAKVTRETLARELVLAAEFRPYQEVDLHSKVAGFLKQISVDVGDRVRAGQVIAVLEIPEMADEEAQAKAAKQHAEAEVERVKSDLERTKSAHEAAHLSYQRLADVMKSRPNLIARQEIDDAFAKDRVAEAQVSTARAAIASAQQQISVSEAALARVRTLHAYTRITVPFAGVISKRFADPGAMIQAGTASSTQTMPLVRVSEIDRLRLVLAVPESAVPRIHVGAPIAIRVAALQRNFTGRVSRFSSREQTSTRTMETEVDVMNTKGDLVPGMYADAMVTLERKENALCVPVSALSISEGKASVLLVGPDGKLESRNVTLGMETADRREILSGLAEGDLIVAGKRGTLRAGDTVRPRESKEGQN
jgi:RND family efflux transporter MFP subunit